MKEQPFEINKSRLEEQKFFSNLQNAVADRLDDMVTDPTLSNANFPFDLGEKVRRGEKIPSSTLVRGAIIAVGQDQRLTPSEIDVLLNKILE